MTSKSALKDAGRVMGFEPDYMNVLSKHIPSSGGNNMSIEDAIVEVKELKDAYEQFPDLFDLARDLQGTPRSASKHASGVVIAPQELDVSLPLHTSAGEIVTQYDGETLEDIGYQVLNAQLKAGNIVESLSVPLSI